MFDYLLRRWFCSQLLQQLSGYHIYFVDGLNHVYRNPDDSRLICYGSPYSLPDPVRSISAEFISALILEFVDCPHEADVAFLYEVCEAQSLAHIPLGNTDYKPS